MNYKVLGVSSGLGVSLFPFKENLIGNIEPRQIFHTKDNEQWNSNFHGIPLSKKLDDLQQYVADVIISSPDCGSGSILRYSRSKELGDHKKNESLKLFFSMVGKIKPKFFLFENLDALFKSFPKEEFEEKLHNYRLVIHNDSVSKWGNSQINRKRLVIVGIRRDLPKKIDKYFKLPHYEDMVKTCEELYGDLNLRNEQLCNVREDIMENVSIHAKRKMSLMSIKHDWQTRLRGKKRWETGPGFNFTTAPGVYRNLDDSFPATARKANRQFNNEGLTLTPRQLARIQGIPDSFKLYYDDTKSKYWINKARCVVTKTPPMEISKWFKVKLEKSLKHI